MVCYDAFVDKSAATVAHMRRHTDYYNTSIDRTVMIGTHNSFISNAYGFGVEEQGLTQLLEKS